MKITDYKTFVFDCDGVLLDSNLIKSTAFYEVTLKYGEQFAEELLQYQKRNGGISRFEKFRYFFSNILKREYTEVEYEHIIQEYGDEVQKKLLNCELTEGMEEFLYSLPKNNRKIIVSGGMQVELREIFEKRNINQHFDGIFGSPDTKRNILQQELKNNQITYPAVFFGDSLLDYQMAKEFDMDFIFLSDYTEFEDWSTFFKDKHIEVYGNLSNILENSCVW